MSAQDQKHVVVVGAGFAGLHAVRVLAKSAAVRVTLVDRHNYHLFQPLLYQVAIAGLEAPQVAYPVRAFLRRRRDVRFRLGHVDGIDPRAQVVSIEGEALKYDQLIVGVGTRTAHFGIPGAVEHAVGLKDLREAMTIRDRVLSACEQATQTDDPKRRKALLTFAIVGGGATGVELAGALGELRRHVIPRDYPEIDLADVRVVLIEAAPRLLGHLSQNSSAYAERFLRSLGVTVMTSTAVAEVRPKGVWTKGGEWIDCYNTVWSAGVAGVSIPGLPEPAHAGRIATRPTLNLDDAPEVYVVGDLNCLEDPSARGPFPLIAPVAIQQGTCAARNILRTIRGEPEMPFRYNDRGNMVTLGRNHAIAEIGSRTITGFPAWSAWLGIHLFNLIGFRNRMMVLSNWAYSYFTYDFAVRIIHDRLRFDDQTP